MNKKIIIIIIIVITTIITLCGCTEEGNTNQGSLEPKTVTMNAQEFSEDNVIEPSQTGLKQYFKSLVYTLC